jgi:hypothetical protein
MPAWMFVICTTPTCAVILLILYVYLYIESICGKYVTKVNFLLVFLDFSHFKSVPRLLFLNFIWTKLAMLVFSRVESNLFFVLDVSL